MLRGSILTLVWGVAEAMLFFVVPDVLVGWIALRRPRAMVAAWLAATVGGIAGAALLHTLVRRGWDPDRIFASLPGAQAGDIAQVREAVAASPTRAFAMGSISGIPVKIYVTEAARADVSLSRTLVLVALNRAPRIGVSGLLAARLGGAVPGGWLGRMIVAVSYLAGWIVFYAWYWAFRKDPADTP